MGTRRMFFRILLAFCFFVIFTIVLIGRIIYLNKEKGSSYEKKVLSQRSYSSSEINYKRGDIVDRNGNKLAVSKKKYDLVLDPVLILADEEYVQNTGEALEKVFDISQEVFEGILKEQSELQYYVMQDYKGLTKDVVEEFEALQDDNNKIKGVTFDERYERYYPYSTVASKIIGFCSSENSGIWGIENYYDDELSGTNGRKYGYFNSDLELVETLKEPVNGNKVVSTIDVNVQGILERHMNEFQEETGSTNMGCIIMNPQNGEIYAMSSYPEFDLNNPRDLSVLYSEEEISKMSDKKKTKMLNKMWRNFCISDAYEPGSTFKPMTVAACLDEAVTNGTRIYSCDGSQKVGGVTIKCVAYSSGGHGSITICQALMESCNDVLMQLGADLGKEKFLSYINAFGFGKKTGIDLPGEAAGGVFTEDTMHSVELATSSFGQGQTVTMIQLAAAFSATINGGNYYEPHVVKEIDSDSGAVVSTKDDSLVRRVVTEKTSQKIRKYLYKTVEEGTASPAQVAGYEIGGKTGTAEKHPTGQGNYLVSFAGFTPVDDPEVVIYVVIDEPNVDDQAHSSYATEFSSEVMKEVLPLLGIYQSSDTKKKDKTEATDIQLPSTKESPDGGLSDDS
ncbi:MAG: peptidoglycan glycosyltransferase, partial [Clostridiaceae bacterium]|nr:peptidoglycan glycosyltransferase [Clostridiaceae bacterium]